MCHSFTAQWSRALVNIAHKTGDLCSVVLRIKINRHYRYGFVSSGAAAGMHPRAAAAGSLRNHLVVDGWVAGGCLHLICPEEPHSPLNKTIMTLDKPPLVWSWREPYCNIAENLINDRFPSHLLYWHHC